MKFICKICGEEIDEEFVGQLSPRSIMRETCPDCIAEMAEDYRWEMKFLRRRGE